MVYNSKVYYLIENRAYYESVKIIGTPKFRTEFQTSSNKSLNKLIKNIEHHFQEHSMDKLTLANNILIPCKLPVAKFAIITHGKTDLEEIIKYLGPTEHYGLVQPDRMRQDYTQFRMADSHQQV